ncbi:hypothetical protein PC115_g25969, partial [Phytophthora cactorum]
MAVQAREGVSLLLDHSWANLDHYMKLGQEVGDIKVDQIAEGIDAGTIFDTSIGFT